MTDFGRKIIKAPRELAEIIGDAEAALSRCIDDDDFDLCAEILMTWPYFRSAMSQTGQFCLRVLANVEDEVGFLPSLTIKVDEIKDLQADKRLHKLLDETYHTVYVMGLLSAAMMNGQWLDYPATTPRSANIAKRLFDLLPHKKPVPQWEAAYAEVSDDVRNSLSHFIAAIALRRALLANNLGLVRDILIVCFDGNISGSPSIINSAKIIGRFVHAT